MNPSNYMDKRVTEHSRPKTQSFFDDDDDDQTFDFHPFRPSNSFNKSLESIQLRGWSSLDGIDSQKISGQRAGVSSDAALIFEIDRKMKEHTDVLLHSVECLSARVTQVEGRTRQVENAFDDLKRLIDFHHERSDRKMREMENILLEVQGSIQDLKDKQEIAETQLQLQVAKLQVSKGDAQSGKNISTVQTSSGKEATSSVSQQPPQPFTPHVMNPQQPQVMHSTDANVPLQIHPPTSAPQLPTRAAAHLPTLAATAHLPPSQLPQNIIHSVPRQEAYYTPPAEIAYRQFNVPLAQQSQSSFPWHQSYRLPPNLPQNPQLPQPSQVQPLTNSQFHHQSGHHAENIPFMVQRSSQPPGLSSHQQFNVGFTQLPRDQPLNKYHSEFTSAGLQVQGLTPQGQVGADDFYRHGVSPASSDGMNKTFKPSPSPQVQGGESTRSQLPTARVLPYAIPTASVVDSESSSGGSGNSVQVDDVIDKVVAMGFRRDLVKATVKKLTENGQSRDLNAVLDKLMNDG